MHTSDNPEQLLTINQLSQKLEIPKPTIRFWEEQLDEIIIPLRTNGGQRRYNTEHVSIIETVKELREMDKSISEIRDILGNGSQTDHNHNSAEFELLSNRIAQLVINEVSKYLRKKAI